MIASPDFSATRIRQQLRAMSRRYERAHVGLEPVLAMTWRVDAHVHGHVASEGSFEAWVAAEPTQLSDCAFVWSENMKDVILSCHTIMWDCLQNGILCRGGIAYGDIIEDNNTNLGQMLLGNAVSKAVKLEQAGAKGCRVLMDQEVPAFLHDYDSSFLSKIYQLFQPFENPLDYQIYDEFKWYYSQSLKDLNTTIGIIQATVERLCLAAKLQYHPRFNWNVRSQEGNIHVKSSMRFTSANEQNVFNIEHTFDWKEMVDLKTRTATNYNRIAKKIQGEALSCTTDKEGCIKFPPVP